MNCESIYVLKKNNSVDNYRKVEEIINRIPWEVEVYGLAKAIIKTNCQHDYDLAHETDDCDFVLNVDEQFIWVMGKYHRMTKQEMLKVCKNKEEISLVNDLEIGFPNHFPQDFFEDLEKWIK